MPIAKITGQGLGAIAFSVALLWGSVAVLRDCERRATDERRMVMREIGLRERHGLPEPVSLPMPFAHRVRPSAG